jgi:hypothetical protein
MAIDDFNPENRGHDDGPEWKKTEIAEAAADGNKISTDAAPLKREGPNQVEGMEEESALIPDFTRSSDEEDENIVFTEEYLNERKEIFEKDMRALQAEMPPPTLQDPVIAQLLMKVQLLGMLADGTILEEPELPVAPMDVDHPVKVVASSQPVTKTEKDVEGEVTSPTKVGVLPIAAEDSIELELPFLNSGPPTPLSDLDVYQENLKTHERIKDTIRHVIAKQRQEASQKNKHLREEFVSIYRPWRLAVWEMDHKKEEERKAASTPGVITPPVVQATTPVTEGPPGRRYKGNSELDFQMALRASAISAQEESERRRRMEATAHPDLNREAVIPDMLEPYEKKAGVFKDANNIIDPADAFDVFGFYPPPNDFTPEEHKIFTDAFMAYPKKWGKIAEELPGRDFQQCIIHYYLTKEEIKYKAKLNKRWTRKGRTRRSARPKSNALMADLNGVRPDEGEEESVPVTDTGRPRRAAAPTFGDSSTDADSGRRGNGAKDGDQVEKPAGRRGGRGGGPGSRGGRRGKAAQQQQQQQHQLLQQHQQHQQPPVQIPQPTAQQPLVAQTATAGPVPLMAKQEPGALDGAVDTVARIKEPSEREEEPLPRGRTSRTRGKEPVYVFEAGDHEPATTKPMHEMGYGSMQPTSYWSVPEVRDFPVLLAHFGRDFEGISNFMKTKTPIMVCFLNLISLAQFLLLTRIPTRSKIISSVKSTPA